MTRSRPLQFARTALFAVPVFAATIAVTQLQTDLGFAPMGAAVAQEEKKPDTRETRRTPALRNKVYEKLAGITA